MRQNLKNKRKKRKIKEMHGKNHVQDVRIEKEKDKKIRQYGVKWEEIYIKRKRRKVLYKSS